MTGAALGPELPPSGHPGGQNPGRGRPALRCPLHAAPTRPVTVSASSGAVTAGPTSRPVAASRREPRFPGLVLVAPRWSDAQIRCFHRTRDGPSAQPGAATRDRCVPLNPVSPSLHLGSHRPPADTRFSVAGYCAPHRRDNVRGQRTRCGFPQTCGTCRHDGDTQARCERGVRALRRQTAPVESTPPRASAELGGAEGHPIPGGQGAPQPQTVLLTRGVRPCEALAWSQPQQPLGSGVWI